MLQSKIFFTIFLAGNSGQKKKHPELTAQYAFIDVVSIKLLPAIEFLDLGLSLK
jgi:hypothetical protein